MNPLPQKAKQAAGILLGVLILWVGYYGSYLPMRKSKAFISTLRGLSEHVRSLRDFEDAVSGPLDMPSPIGQEELVRNVGNLILGTIARPETSPEVARAAARFVENYFEPIIRRGKGMSFEQDYYILGLMNQVVFARTGDEQYFKTAKEYYRRGLELGPRRPQSLYGIFDIYRAEGDVQKTVETANQILSQWPDDERVRRTLEEFLATGTQPSPAP
ncbi:hypothetical protein C4587_01065 [Candidatus Parcubacteria bacterium]|nr:MAG: hypothetical protein C4587_01065 [Candidatus Parcubacteria bacterium]